MRSSDGDLSLSLRAEVSVTEDRQKVLMAVRNVFGECSYETEERPDSVTLLSTDRACLQKIHDQLRDRHVRDAARRLMLKSIEGNRMTLLLNRQAALVGVVATVSSGDESPLGPLVLEVQTRDPQSLLDWLTLYQTPEEPQSPGHPELPTSP